MRTLVIDLDRDYAETLTQVLKNGGCQVDMVSTSRDAVALLQELRFDAVLMDTRFLASSARAILQQIYSGISRYEDSPQVCLMSNSSTTSLLEQARINGAMESIPADAESILSIVRKTNDSTVVLVAGVAASAELKRALLQEGYPAIVIHSLDDAIRQLFDGTYAVVFLETGTVGLTESDELLVLRRLTADALACLASAHTDNHVRHVVKPREIFEMTELLPELQKEMNETEHRMSQRRA